MMKNLLFTLFVCFTQMVILPQNAQNLYAHTAKNTGLAKCLVACAANAGNLEVVQAGLICTSNSLTAFVSNNNAEPDYEGIFVLTNNNTQVVTHTSTNGEFPVITQVGEYSLWYLNFCIEGFPEGMPTILPNITTVAQIAALVSAAGDAAAITAPYTINIIPDITIEVTPVCYEEYGGYVLNVRIGGGLPQFNNAGSYLVSPPFNNPSAAIWNEDAAAAGYVEGIITNAGQPFYAEQIVTVNAANYDSSCSTTANTTMPINGCGNFSAINDSIFIMDNETVIFNVLSNDYGMGIQVISMVQPANGNVVWDYTGNFIYIPNPGFSGVDVFTYQIQNQFGYISSASVYIWRYDLSVPLTLSWGANCSSNNTTYTVSVSILGGVPPFLVSGDYNGTFNNNTTINFTKIDGDAFYIQVIDATGSIIILSEYPPSCNHHWWWCEPSIFPNNPSLCPVGSSIELSVPYADEYPFIMWTLPDSTTFEGSALTTSMAGQYTVTTTNWEGCTNTASTVVTVNQPLPMPAINVSETSGVAPNDGVVCLGSATSLVIWLYGYDVTYLWSNGSNSSSITVSPTTTTTYTVTATDIYSGCKGIASTTITVNPPPITVIEGNTTACAGETITLTASGGAHYLWSNGQTSATINATLPVGTTTMSVLVTDENACTGSTNVALTTHPLPTPAIGITETSGTINNDGIVCAGEPVWLAVVEEGAMYEWSTGDMGAAITIYPDETTPYTITATNLFGCTALAETLIQVNPLPAIATAATPNTFCQEPFTGQASVVTPTQPQFTYTWSTGSTEQNIGQINGGVYAVTVANTTTNCSSIAVVEVLQNTIEPIIWAIGNAPSTCGGNNGSITIGGLDAGMAYAVNYHKNDVQQPTINFVAPEQGEVTIPNLSNGNYTNIVVTAPGNCLSNEVSVALNNPPLPAITILNPIINLCEGATDLEISFTETGNTPNQFSVVAGTPALSNFSSINNAPFTASPLVIPLPSTALPQQGYQFLLTLNDTTTNCVAQPIPITLNLNHLPIVQLFTDSLICVGETITAGVSVIGADVTTVSWNSSDTAVATINSLGKITGISPGATTIMLTAITVSTGCMAWANQTVVVETCCALSSSEPSIACFSETDYTVSFSIQGGQPPYWVNGTPITDNFYQSNLLNTLTYIFDITDAQGCSFTITGSNAVCNPACALSMALQPVYYGEGCIDGFEVVVQNGPATPPNYQYTVNGGEWQFSPQFTALPAGNYTVSVLTGCGVHQHLSTFTQAQSALQVNVTITPIENNTYQGSASISGGSGSYNVLWSNGSVGNNAYLGSLPDTASVTVTDAAGCAKTVVFTKNGAVSIPDNQPHNAANLFSLYPNPAYNQVHISAQTPTYQPATIYLYTPYGQLITQRQTYFTQPETVDINHLPAGLYLVVVATGAKFQTFKLWCGGLR